MYIFNFKNYYLICMMIVLSSCIGTNYSTPLVDKNQSEDIVIFDADSTIISLYGHMKEWNKFWGIVDVDSPKDYECLFLCIKVKYRYPIFVKDLNVDIEAIKEGKVSPICEGVVYYNTWSEMLKININDTIKNYSYGEDEYNSSDGLCYIDSRDKKLIGCDTLIIYPKIKFSTNGKEYSISRTDTLYRTVEKSFRLISY